MNANAVRKLLRAECKAAGGEGNFARQIGVTQQLVNAVLRGAREPRGRILDALDLEVVVTYRRKKPTADASNCSFQTAFLFRGAGSEPRDRNDDGGLE